MVPLEGRALYARSCPSVPVEPPLYTAHTSPVPDVVSSEVTTGDPEVYPNVPALRATRVRVGEPVADAPNEKAVKGPWLEVT